jgi:hypothetical protein
MTALSKPTASAEVAHNKSPSTPHSAELSVVMDMLTRSDLPMDRAEALLARLDMIRERDESAAYNDAMRQVKANLPVVGRTTANSHTKKNYADLADISEACDKIIAEYGFSTEYWPFNSEKPEHLGIGCTVSHANGHKREYRADVPLDGAGAKGNANKPAIHAWKSTMTYGRRALKEAIFDIATSDDDGNGAIRPVVDEHETITDEQVIKLRNALLNTDTDEKAFLQRAKIDRLEDLWASNFDGALAVINGRGKGGAK